MNRLMQSVAAAAAALVVAAAAPAHAQGVAGKKVLFVTSYHQGYPWSDGEEKGASTALQGSGVQVKFFRMDTKRHQDEGFRKKAGELARAEIESFRPDVVIVADDPAVQYVLQAHYRGAKLPFVFCGVNWDAAKYGLPYANATGMVEVAPVKELVANLRAHAKGPRLGYLTVDSETERIEGPMYAKTLGAPFTSEVYAKTFAEWKAAFHRMQGEVDMILLGNTAGINDWNEAEAKTLVLAGSKVPSGAAYDFMMPYAMLGLTKIEEEQGAWAGTTALRILKGTAPSAIPIASNKQSKIFMNVKLAAAAGVVMKPEIVRSAQVVQ
jgi:ABC-type uncharacterized transport system substrate-binding protein